VISDEQRLLRGFRLENILHAAKRLQAAAKIRIRPLFSKSLAPWHSSIGG